MNKKQHWEQVYQTKSSDSVSWFQPKPELSIQLINDCNIGKDKNIIDVGAGASRLVDFLIDDGYAKVSVLDLSENALSISKKRLAHKSDKVNWIVQDITHFQPEQKYSLWHDRAVFHFLTDKNDRQKYREILESSIEEGGKVIIASFSLNGPKKCSGLDIVQYGADKIQQELGKQFQLIKTKAESHKAPRGFYQEFNYFVFQRI